MPEYQVEVTREGRWWMINVPAVDGVTQARRVSEVERMARELVAVSTYDRLDDITVDLVFADIEGVQVEARLDTIHRDRQLAATVEESVAGRTKDLVKDLVARDAPLRDIGELLGLSFQRVHQLANT